MPCTTCCSNRNATVIGARFFLLFSLVRFFFSLCLLLIFNLHINCNGSVWLFRLRSTHTKRVACLNAFLLLLFFSFWWCRYSLTSVSLSLSLPRSLIIKSFFIFTVNFLPFFSLQSTPSVAALCLIHVLALIWWLVFFLSTFLFLLAHLNNGFKNPRTNEHMHTHTIKSITLFVPPLREPNKRATRIRNTFYASNSNHLNFDLKKMEKCLNLFSILCFNWTASAETAIICVSVAAVAITIFHIFFFFFFVFAIHSKRFKRLILIPFIDVYFAKFDACFFSAVVRLKQCHRMTFHQFCYFAFSRTRLVFV